MHQQGLVLGTELLRQRVLISVHPPYHGPLAAGRALMRLCARAYDTEGMLLGCETFVSVCHS